MNHIIDTNKTPYCPTGLTVKEHINNGKVDVSKISLFVSESQKKWIQGYDLLKELKPKSPLNANVLDYLYEHQELIPKWWKKEWGIFFWGTIYRDSDGRLYVRYLFWNVGAWRWGYGWLDNGWRGLDPAALLASASDSESKTSLEPSSSELPDVLSINGVEYVKNVKGKK